MASDQGVIPNSEIQQSSQVNNEKQDSANRYSTAAHKGMFPTKEHAIVIDSVEGISVKTYIQELAKIINPHNIRFVSRISKNRICVYLDSKETVKQIVDNKSTISINNSILTIRPLITQNKRLILSNVCPIIPHSVIIDELTKLKIRIGSTMTFLRAGMSEPGFSHILSFRRQIYIHPDDMDKVPETMKIKYDDTAFWIYPSSDAISCFLCKEHGHFANHCPMNEQKDNPSGHREDIHNEKNQLSPSSFPALKPSSTASPPIDNLPPKNVKRPLSSSLSSKSEPSETLCPIASEEILTHLKETVSDNNNLQSISPESMDYKNHQSNDFTLTKSNSKSNKKSKLEISAAEESDKLENQLAPLKETLSQTSNKYVLNWLQLKSLFEKTKNCINIEETVLEFTPHIKRLLLMLEETYPLLTDKSIKRRFTNLKKKLKSIDKINEISNSSDSDEDSI